MVNKICFDTNVCAMRGLPVKTALYLLSVYFGNHINSKEELNKCVDKGFVVYYNYNDGNPNRVELTEKGIELVENLILDSEFKPMTKDGDRFEVLADALRDLYPDGKKAGTNYYWKDSHGVIVKKLKALVKKYGDTFTNEEAIAATKKYVDSFNGDYRFMQLLKYFICKNVIKGGEVEEQSQLLSFIENANQEDIPDTQTTIDWDVELR